jgi:hypothetical protein
MQNSGLNIIGLSKLPTDKIVEFTAIEMGLVFAAERLSRLERKHHFDPPDYIQSSKFGTKIAIQSLWLQT